MTRCAPAPGRVPRRAFLLTCWRALLRSLRGPIVELLRDLRALLWPTACVHCGAPDRDCCAHCLARIRAPAPLLRAELGVPVFARAPYDGALRALLLACKHGGRASAASELGRALRAPLRAALATAGESRPLIVAAPSSAAQLRRRGFRPVELFVAHAQRGAAPRGEPCGEPLRALRAAWGRRGQIGLAPRARAANARLLRVRPGARHRLRGREVVLVDDVLTTGATLRAARDAVESAGARVVAAAVLCLVETRAEPALGNRAAEGWKPPSRVE